MQDLWGSQAARGLARGLAALCAVSVCAQAGAQARGDVLACGSAAAPSLRLAWQEAPGADSVAVLAGSAARLRVENAARVGVFARLDVTLTTSDGAVTRRLPDVWLEPGRATYVPVALDTDARLDATAYVTALATALPARGASLGRAVAPALYFHEDNGRLRVYGEGALRTRFAGGVLPAGVGRPDAVPAGATLEMTFDASSGEAVSGSATFDEDAAVRRERAAAGRVTPQGGR